MFTGLIQGMGRVIQVSKKGLHGKLLISCDIPLKNLKQGNSIALDGCCLTVTSKKGKNLSFDFSEETARKTIIQYYKQGTLVNLEEPLKVGDRLGGHFVLGHVDGVGKIVALKRYAGSTEIEISPPCHLRKYIIPKGSMALDGISLTVMPTRRGNFKVCLIPHTEKVTNLAHKKVGDLVNLEADILGKYLESLILKKKR